MMETGIFVRVCVKGRWCALDIADPEMPAPELLGWLASLSQDELERTMSIVRLAMGVRRRSVENP